jgi:hypothetical protein
MFTDRGTLCMAIAIIGSAAIGARIITGACGCTESIGAGSSRRARSMVAEV